MPVNLIPGTSGNDTLPGTEFADKFTLGDGGDDTATGLGGDDGFVMGSAFTAADSLDGGTGSDVVILNGDYSAANAVVFGAATMTNVESLILRTAHNYDLTTNNATIATGQTLTMDASGLGAGDSLTFNGSAETNGHFQITGGAGNDTLTGGAIADSFALDLGGNDIANGGGGTDAFRMGSAFTAADSINGGGGNDTVFLNGDYSAGLTLGPSSLTNVETLHLGDGHSYNLTSDDGTVGAGQILTVYASTLGASDSVAFNGAAETNGFFNFFGGAGNDTLTGGARADYFFLGQGGNDTANGGGGFDLFLMGAALTQTDKIDGGSGFDTVVLNGDYTGDNAVVFNSTTMTNVEYIALHSGNSYNLVSDDATVAAGKSLIVDGSFLGPADSVNFNGSGETDGSFFLIDGLGNDILRGGAGSDILAIGGGGTDIGAGGGGNDLVDVYGQLDSTDQFDGGTGYDIMELSAGATVTGNYTGANALVLTFAMMSHFEELDLDSGGSYDITTVDANAATGITFTVDASFLGAGETLTFNGSAEEDASFYIYDGAGDDVLTGGTNADTFDLRGGGNDTANGGADDDSFILGAAFNAGDKIDGGSGNDTVFLDGNYVGGRAVIFNATTMVAVEAISFASGHSYDLTTNDTTVDSFFNPTLTVNGSTLNSGDTLIFDGSAEADSNFTFIGGAGHDILTGGQFGDTFELGATLKATDKINGFTGFDEVDLNGDYSGVNALVFNPATMIRVELLVLSAGHSYDLTTDNLTVLSGKTLTVNASALGAGDVLTFNGVAETNGAFAITGGADIDTVTLGNAGVLASSTFDGGAGQDVLSLNGDFSGGAVFSASTISNVEQVLLAAGHSYNLTTADGNLAAGQDLQIDGGNLGVSDVLAVDGSAETNGHLVILGGAGNDVITGGQGADSYQLFKGGDDTLHGGSSNDTIVMAAALTAADSLDGGAGNDTLTLGGDYTGGNAVVFNATTITNIEVIYFFAGHSYDLTANDGNLTGAQTLSVDASTLGAGDTLTFDGSAETSGHFAFTGGAGNDVLTGGGGSDSFDLSVGGDDTVQGGGGDSQFNMGGALTAADSIEGGEGTDTVDLSGDYTGGNAVTLLATTITNIEKFTLEAGNSYDLTTDDATVANGLTFTVDATALGATDSLTFDGFAETNGHFTIDGGAGDDVLTGGQGADTFNLNLGGNDTVTGGAGNDFFVMGGGLTASDHLDGGSGFNQMTIDGDYSAGVTLGATTMLNIQSIGFGPGHDYNFTTDDATVAAAANLNFNATALGAGDSIIIDGSAETDGTFSFSGGAGDDTFTGGAGNDLLTGGGGADTLTGNGGADTFVYTAVSDSTGSTFDAIQSIDFNSDVLKISGFATAVGVIDTAVTTGALSAASFDSDLGAAIGAGQLASNDAVLFTADSGTLSGHTFLVVDVNGSAGYQASADLVIDVTGYSGTLTVGDFI